MKTIKTLLIFTAGIFMLLTCTQEDIFSDEDILTTTLRKSNDKVVFVTVPFKSSFSTSPGTMENPVVCDDLDLVIQVGGGEATHLGTFTTEMSFCVDPNFFYFGVVGTFYAANGDELWISVPTGQVIPNPELPEPYLFYFTDDFFFVGGTGRFAGATGGGTTNSFVEATLTTDHQWDGELTFKPGKK
jgi:hypothetical protein